MRDLEVRVLDQPRETVRGEQRAEDEPEERGHVGRSSGAMPGEAELAVDLALRAEGDPEGLADETRVRRASGREVGTRSEPPSSPAVGPEHPALLLAQIEGRAARAPLQSRGGLREPRGERPILGRRRRSPRAPSRGARRIGLSAAESGWHARHVREPSRLP